MVALSELLVSGTAGRGAKTEPEPDQVPPDRGRVAVNVPCGLFGAFALMPFQKAATPDGVVVPAGSVARKSVAMVAAVPTLPLAAIGVSLMRQGPEPVVHRTCSTPSAPRASPISGISGLLGSGVVTSAQTPGRMTEAGAAPRAAPALVAPDRVVAATAGAAPAVARAAASTPYRPAARTPERETIGARDMAPPGRARVTTLRPYAAGPRQPDVPFR